MTFTTTTDRNPRYINFYNSVGGCCYSMLARTRRPENAYANGSARGIYSILCILLRGQRDMTNKEIFDRLVEFSKNKRQIKVTPIWPGQEKFAGATCPQGWYGRGY